MSTSIARAFSDAAKLYDIYATQQREVCTALAELVTDLVADDALVLDAGCGTGYLAAHLKDRRISWDVLGLDVSEGMCQLADEHMPCVVAHMQALPLQNNSLDMVFSSLSLQWVEDIEYTFVQFYDALKSGSFVAISSYGDGTLSELASSFSAVDNAAHVRTFHPIRNYVDAMMRAGFNIEQIKQETMIRQDADLLSLLRYLKHIGAHTLGDGRRKSLMTPRQLQRVEEHYLAQYGEIRSGWNVVYIIARKP